MIAGLLPPSVSCVERFDDALDAELMPGEAELIARAIEARRREFTTTRHCARQALAVLGFPSVSILAGEHREPCWPEGVVGSLTHCDGYRAAAVTTEWLSIGIDAEPAWPLPDGLLRIVALPQDLAALPSTSGVCWDRLLFSIKESVYKAWFSLTGRWLGFEEAEVVIDRDGTFRARLLVPGPPGITGFTGRWTVANGLIGTAVVVPQQGE
ncbi:4'-phosphopantetheinyl transferase superfamily protein [Nonomuraea sp. K274]|uniref:4'-phosphopantetheinyl transferase superfamily protein n=1 Tax=Nonomuraea cypriaca TaxID=1187855 RepID=A0A931AAI8_9ACTN|nr:4'-phosphopantetheinyl transferase superfamily protein [Nonomuraea cypriaca]MBF8187053.1 4'-phosphopantetheinyl transferase superfamily protein [Nonomuraea cypriaca]